MRKALKRPRRSRHRQLKTELLDWLQRPRSPRRRSSPTIGNHGAYHCSGPNKKYICSNTSAPDYRCAKSPRLTCSVPIPHPGVINRRLHAGCRQAVHRTALESVLSIVTNPARQARASFGANANSIEPQGVGDAQCQPKIIQHNSSEMPEYRYGTTRTSCAQTSWNRKRTG